MMFLGVILIKWSYLEQKLILKKAGSPENPCRGWEVEMTLVWMLQTSFRLVKGVCELTVLGFLLSEAKSRLRDLIKQYEVHKTVESRHDLNKKGITRLK